MMRRWIVHTMLWMGLAVLVPSAHAQPDAARTAFEAGNVRYEAGAYDAALARYRQALDSGYASGALYHNMGNAYFRLDSLGQAVRYYEKARLLLPTDRRLEHNLAIARSRVTDAVPRLPTSPWATWWHRLAARLGAWGFFAAGLLGCGVGLALAAHRIWTGTRAPWHRRTMAVALLVGGLLLAAAFAASLEPRLDRRVVVLAEAIPLREAADDGAASARMLYEGTVLDVLAAQDDWLRVRLSNGATGWVAAPATGAI
ncbi:MAG: SH3 domain-containing protein [Bacteroidetes bacterium]|jgi:tetratricopeptide (TPR) repeat protein|nr:SH3 domain-containing protein [Bacteroidota bacterium]